MYNSLIEKFAQNNIHASFVEDKAGAVKQVLELIPLGSSIGFCGSETIKEIGLRDYFLNHADQYKLLYPYAANLSKEEAYEIRRQGLLADILLTSSNAITEKGEIVNIDGTGNRVAGINFGPKKVILVVGKNKVVPSLAEAWKRIATTAAPLNNKRLTTGNPCIVTGQCQNCQLPTRICRLYNVVKGQMLTGRLYLIIVNQVLGY